MRNCNFTKPVLLLLLWLTACSDELPRIPRLSTDAVILAFGDSITYGTGARKNESYPAILEDLSGREVINAGNPGEVSADGLARLPGLLDMYQPDLLILCHGGNDILRKKNLVTMRNNVQQMIMRAQARNIPVVLLGVPEFGLLMSVSKYYDEIADATGVVYIRDLLPKIIKDTSLKSDPIHPNRDGYLLMGKSIYTVLQEAGAF
jgi:acyl-CoA thioesterase-1